MSQLQLVLLLVLFALQVDILYYACIINILFLHFIGIQNNIGYFIGNELLGISLGLGLGTLLIVGTIYYYMTAKPRPLSDVKVVSTDGNPQMFDASLGAVRSM